MRRIAVFPSRELTESLILPEHITKTNVRHFPPETMIRHVMADLGRDRDKLSQSLAP